jgi:hypothetical protein
MNHKKLLPALPRGTAAGTAPWRAQASLGYEGTCCYKSPISVGAWTSCMLAIVGDFTQECLALAPDASRPGLRVVRELDALTCVSSVLDAHGLVSVAEGLAGLSTSDFRRNELQMQSVETPRE